MTETALREIAPFRWTEQRIQAALLVAEDELTLDEISQRVGVAPRTLDYWKANPEFAARVGDHVGVLQAAMLRYRVAKKRERLKVLDRIHTKLLTVIEERAAEWAEAPDDCPAGGGTGLVVRQIKVVGAGPMAREVEEFAVDVGTLRELRAVHEQAAKELGQWVEKSELAGSLRREYVIIRDAS